MSEIKVDTLTGKTTANDITVTVGASATQSLETGLVKAFVHFDQSDQSPDASLNISSIADTAVGQSSPKFTNSFSSVQFAVVGSQAGSSAIDVVMSGPFTADSGGGSFMRYRDGSVDTDTNNVSQICCGDLA